MDPVFVLSEWQITAQLPKQNVHAVLLQKAQIAGFLGFICDYHINNSIINLLTRYITCQGGGGLSSTEAMGPASLMDSNMLLCALTL